MAVANTGLKVKDQGHYAVCTDTVCTKSTIYNQVIAVQSMKSLSNAYHIFLQ